MARNLSHRVLTRVRDAKGTSLVEAALITPLLLLLTLSIENGVSQATRFVVTGAQMDDPAHPGTKLNRADSIKLAMRQATPTLTIPDSAFTFTSLPPKATVWVARPGGR